MTQEERLQKLKNLNSEERMLHNRLKDIHHEKKQLIHKIKKSCKHKEITCYREYGHGMHRPEYNYICKICDQYLSFDEYCSADAKIEDINL